MNYLLIINLYNKNRDTFDIGNISNINFVFGGIAKNYPQQVQYKDNHFLIPITESEKQYLSGNVIRHYEITYSDGTSKITDNTQGSLEQYITLDTRYDDLVNVKIRAKYSESREFALHRQRDRKKEEFHEYDLYCEECKKEAKKELGL